MDAEIKSPLPARPVPGQVENKIDQKKENLTSSPKEETETKISKGKDMKKIGLIVVAIMVIVVAIFLVIKAMNGKTGVGSKEMTINYWGVWEEPSVMRAVLADFEAKNPKVKVNYVRKDIDNYRTILKGRLNKTEQEGVEIPDIFTIHNSWIPMFSEELAPIPTTMAVELNLDENFYGVYGRDLKVKNAYQAIPLYFDGLILYYNKDLVSSSNLPKSWWELQQEASKLTITNENGQIIQSGVAMGLADNIDHWSDIVGLMLKQSGAKLLSQDPKEVTKLTDVLTYYTQFASSYGVWDASLPSSTQMFANGKLAFYFGPGWRMYNLADMNPNLNYGTVKVPQLPTLTGVSPEEIDSNADLTDITWSSYWVEGVNKNSSKKEAALELLKYLASKEALEKMSVAASQIRGIGLAPARKDMGQTAVSEPRLKALVDSAQQARGGWLSSRTFDDGLNDEMMAYFKDAVNVFATGRNDSSAIEALTAGIRQIAVKYKIEE